MNNTVNRQFNETLSLRRTRQGFTLVELLVVIAIILFLVALLMPALSRIKETAKNTKCMSNMRQISMATFMYAADNDGFAPWDAKTVGKNEYFVVRSHTNGDPGYEDTYPKNKWFAEYLPGGALNKMNPIGYCPKGGLLGDVGPNVSDAPYFNFSYGINPDLGEDWWLTNGHNDRGSAALNQIKNPAGVALWVESNRQKTYEKGDAITGRHFATSKKPAQVPGPTVGKYTIYQYEGKMNVVYVDQHMGTIKILDQTPMWSCSFWRFTNGTQCNPGECGFCDKKLKGY
jgi:prepilin-type N-terminal cleavage/methylation domain-containing protein